MNILIKSENWQLMFNKHFSKPSVKAYVTFTSYKFTWFTFIIMMDN